jgi:hypothetical protein
MNEDEVTTQAVRVKRQYAALLRRLARQPRPMSWIDKVSLGLDPMPVLSQGRPALPPDVHEALVAMWTAIFLENARAEAARMAAAEAWVRSHEEGRAE